MKTRGIKLCIWALCAAILCTLLPLSPARAEASALVLDATAQVGTQATDTYGNNYVPTSYKNGTKVMVNVKLPLVKNAKIKGNITIRPDTSDYETSPIVAGNLQRVISNAAAVWLTEFPLEVKASAINGRYPVNFVAEYMADDGSGVIAAASQRLTVFVEIKDASPVPTPTPEPTPEPSAPVTKPQSQPRVIVSKYSVSADKIYAGEEFDLTLELTNTSASRNVQNVKVTVSSADGMLLPVGGSNITYFAKINRQAKVQTTYRFRAQPDTPAKPQNLSVAIAYEDNQAAALSEEATLSIPIFQQIRFKANEPKVYEATAGESISVSVPVYNMGKSTLYNVMATVEGEGLRAEQSVYAGNLESGANKTLEMNVLVSDEALAKKQTQNGGQSGEMSPEDAEKYQGVARNTGVSVAPGGAIMDGMFSGGSQSYEFPGEVVITFEDDNGDKYTQRVAFNAVVNQQMEYPTDMPTEPSEPEAVRKPVWPWIVGGVIAAAAVGGIIVVTVTKARRRKRLLEDENL
ncbi:MAG: hypothetical protein PHD32_08375 [Eubacteriales bacterium]|nr:hypothetical protein [Eubacteriales bacterium]